jgi:hypothetical protein
MKSAIKGTRRRATESLRNFHLPLPASVYDALRQEADAVGKPATAVAREAIEQWLGDRKRMMVRESISAYAARHAGTLVDLDPGLERAALEVLRAKKPRR